MSSAPLPPPASTSATASPPSTYAPVQASPAQIQQIASDLNTLRTQLQGMEGDHHALVTTMARARRMHVIVLVLSASVAATAWWFGLSAWLRFYLFPITVALVLTFSITSRMLSRWMEGRIQALRRVVDDASAQLAQVQPQAAPPSEQVRNFS